MSIAWCGSEASSWFGSWAGAAIGPMASSGLSRWRASAAFSLALLPGDDQPDAELAELSSRAGRGDYAACGAISARAALDNAEHFCATPRASSGTKPHGASRRRSCHAGLYWPGHERPASTTSARWRPRAPAAAIVFYRALVQAANTAPIDALIAALRGARPQPAAALRRRASRTAGVGRSSRATPRPRRRPIVSQRHRLRGRQRRRHAHRDRLFDAADCPVLQVVFAGGDEARGATARAASRRRDIAMNVALPEVDGRIITRAISFKAPRVAIR